MAENKNKSWRNSSNKWAYLKVAFHLRERMIRGRLVELGVLKRDSNNSHNNIDLENGHI